MGLDYCLLFPRHRHINYDYWKNAKVADKDCAVAVDGYVANFFVM